MIQANELRCGNKVIWRNVLFTVDADFIERAELCKWQDRDGTPCHPERIPLSPEVLEACGFEKNDWTDSGKFVYEGWALEFVMIDKEYRLDGNDGQYRPLKYLHEMQNLYHALTGTELQVDPIKLSVAVKGVREAGKQA